MGTSYFFMIICSNSRWDSGIFEAISSRLDSAGAEAGKTRSIPNGFPSTRSRIHLISASISSGVCIASPSTAKPPELITATATSLQWVKDTMGNSTPS